MVAAKRKVPAKVKAPPGPPLAPRGRLTYEMGVMMGPTGCGKTTGAELVALDYHRAGGKVWAVDPSRAWRGVRGVTPVWPANGLPGLDKLLVEMQSWGPGLVIFDDADKYMRRPTQVRDDWMTSFRHYQKDLILISRRPQGIPKDAISNARWFALYAGSMTEPGARAYMREAIDVKLVKQTPTEEWHYLYLYRVGAVWSSEVRKTTPRTVVTRSDKPA